MLTIKKLLKSILVILPNLFLTYYFYSRHIIIDKNLQPLELADRHSVSLTQQTLPGDIQGWNWKVYRNQLEVKFLLLCTYSSQVESISDITYNLRVYWYISTLV